MDAGEQRNPPPQVRAPAPALRTRAVVALVRPLGANHDVLRAAAELAVERDATLLVLGTLDPLIADWVDGVDIAGPALEAAHGELFATCVENLFDVAVVWGVHVLWGRLAPEVHRVAEHVEVLGVVRGSRRPHTGRHRLRRRITGRLDTLLAGLDVRTV